MAQFLKLVQKTILEIESHLMEDISVSSICRKSYVSPFYLQRIFRNYTGESIGNYIRRRRLSLALEDLRANKESVLQIALKYGFGSSEAFSRSCKAVYGYSPLNLRKMRSLGKPITKSPLTDKELEYLHQYASQKPSIRQIDSFSVSGKEVHFESPLHSPHRYMSFVTKVWKEFRPLILQSKKLDTREMIGLSYGIYRQFLIPGEHTSYLACCRLKQKEKRGPSEFVTRKIPGGLYAVFSFKGYHIQTQYMINYIYSTWLPSSKYFRREGPEFTILDCRPHPPDPETSPVKYFLPIVRRS